MNESKILITGGAGFIGSHLALKLAALGKKVVVIDSVNDYYSVSLKEHRINSLRECQNIEFFKLNLENSHEVGELFRKYTFETVYHLAAQAGVRLPPTSSFKYVESNLIGFMNLLLQVRDSQISDFVYASSSSIYGNSAETPFHEDIKELNPISLYGATKLVNEVLVKATLLHHKTRSRGIRFFTVYGQMGRPDMAYFRILSSLLEDKPLPQYGNDNLLRDFTYVGDVIESMQLLTTNLKNHEPGFADVVNIGGGTPRTLSEMIRILENLSGKKLKVENRDSFPTDVVQTIASKRYQEELIGFTPITSLEVGLSEFYSWSMQPEVRGRIAVWSQ